MSRNLTTLDPASTYQYLLQTDVDDAIQDGLGNPFVPALAQNATQAVNAFNASYATQAGLADTASFALTAGTASYTLTASYFSGSIETATSSSYSLSSSFSISSSVSVSSSFSTTSSFSLTASFVSGAILNTPDSFTSYPPVSTIVTLSQAEYTALAVKDANTFYAIV